MSCEVLARTHDKAKRRLIVPSESYKWLAQYDRQTPGERRET